MKTNVKTKSKRKGRINMRGFWAKETRQIQMKLRKKQMIKSRISRLMILNKKSKQLRKFLKKRIKVVTLKRITKEITKMPQKHNNRIKNSKHLV